MIFAVAMTFIDQTIVSIAVPELQKDLQLSSTGVQWIINGYLLSLAALFAFGGRLGDIYGHRTLVVIGVIVFAAASGLCGATPTGDLAEAWIITFRVIQGAGAALMFPAALAIVVSAFPVSGRGQAMAIFFGITGGLTAVGPLAGGYLTEIDWRAIFWVNIPVAIIALVLTAIAKPSNEGKSAPIDFRGAVLISAGMGLAVLGLQQSSAWGWGSPATWGAIAVGVALIGAFIHNQLRESEPLLRVRIFANRAFAADNAILFFLMIAFVPLFFFASTYSQISLGDDASQAGTFLLTFFLGFAAASQVGGRILDSTGARPTVVAGCLVAAAGFFLWGKQMPDLDYSTQWYWIVMAGAGCGLILGPANTDAINRAPRATYGEVTGITQTVRNFGSAIGLAVLGTILISENRTNIESSLADLGIGKERADAIALSLSQSGGSGASSAFSDQMGVSAEKIFAAVQLDYALATRTVFYVMAGVMALAFVVALLTMQPGRVEEAE
ncbi:MAG TPA: MFS transporter [Solirubrobacterales bacterium]|nr:MFS transporter [Solirubrobacterales bacterium]